MNEPWCSAYLGYGSGEHAPGKRNFDEHWRVAHNLLLAHGLAIRVYRELKLKAEIGITLNLIPQEPISQRPDDIKAAWARDGFQNRWYLDPLFKGHYPLDMPEAEALVGSDLQSGDLTLIAAPLDFLGINYYSRDRIGADDRGQPVVHPPRGPLTAMNWEICPQGLFDLLFRVHQDYDPIPLYLTENGAACEDLLEEGRVADVEGHPI